MHLGKFALGGFGVIMTEATAIERDACIAPGDLGIRSNDYIPGLRQATAVENTLRLPGYQVEYAWEVRKQSGFATATFGLILDAGQAKDILQQGPADLIALGRQTLDDPYWALHAAQDLEADPNFEMWHQSAAWWLQKRAGGLARFGRAN